MVVCLWCELRMRTVEKNTIDLARSRVILLSGFRCEQELTQKKDLKN